MYFESFLLDHMAHGDHSKTGPHVLPLRDRVAEGS